ncbi:MAG: hypothetical protein KAJ57_12685 [Woeseiaceae bacterium]|nr:hypothetical protein [Woeseiaceae bacterium]
MRIEDANGNEILTLEEWEKLYDTPQQSHQWVQHRSAYSVAEFMLNHDGASHIQARVSDAFGQSLMLERAIPEYEQRFDKYGRGRVHDLGIFGTSSDGRSVFVGVEAKVDEPFGATVHDSYLQAKANQITGKSTNAPERIEKLLALHFAEPDTSMFDIRYQLLYATAGTLAAEADISVLYVVVFKTPLYDESIGANNYRDYIHFVNKVGGKPVALGDKGAVAHQLELGGRELLCLHEYFAL